MLLRHALAAFPLLALVACTAPLVDSTGGGAGGAGGSEGAGGLYDPPDGKASRQEPPAFTVGGFEVALPPTTIAPGEELYPCFIAPLELVGSSRVVGGGKLTTGPGLHHGNVTARPKTGEGFRPCPDEQGSTAGEAADVIAGGTVLFGSTTQFEGTEWRVFPDGMGFPIGQDWEVVFRMHYLNPTAEPIELAPAYAWFTIDPAKVTHLLGAFIWVYGGFEIPPNAEHTVAAECALTAPMQIVSMMPHMHKLGTRYWSEFAGGALDGTVFLDTPGYNPDGLITMFEPALDLSKAEGFRYGCTWQNTFDKPIVEGVGDNEMCMLFGYAYPYEAALSAYAASGGACVTIPPPPPGEGVGNPGAGGGAGG